MGSIVLHLEFYNIIFNLLGLIEFPFHFLKVFLLDMKQEQSAEYCNNKNMVGNLLQLNFYNKMIEIVGFMELKNVNHK